MLYEVITLTGFMGLTIGPIIGAYINTFSNGHELVIMAFGATAAVFLGLSQSVQQNGTFPSQSVLAATKPS